MLKQYSRFRGSLIPGLLVSVFLLILAFAIFFTLFDATGANKSTFLTLSPRVIGLLKFTIFQATLSTILSIIIGIILAWSLAHQSRFFARSLLIALFSSSLVLPTIIVVFGLITILGRNGWLNHLSLYLFNHTFEGFLYGLSGILIAHVYLNASYAARALLHSFEAIPKQRYKLAKSLGFSVFKRFILIEWPAIKQSVLSIASVVFLLTFTSFAIVLILGGNPSYNTLEVAIYEAVKLDFDISLALELAFLQLGISVILVFFSSNLKTNISNVKMQSLFIPWAEPLFVRFLQITIIFVSCVFFILPLIAIVFDGINADFIRILKSTIFIKSFSTSVIIASISSIITVVFTLFLSNARRNFALKSRISQSKVGKIIEFMISFSGSLYLAIPSLVLGLGFFLLSQKFIAPHLFWASFALLSANVLMSLPFSISVIYPSMLKTATRYDKLCFSLNISGFKRWIYCEWPFLKESIGYAIALSFCLSLGDLGIISLFGNQDFSTLPWYLYGLMGSYQNNDAAGVALILLGLTLSVFIFVPKIFAKENFVKG
ncbi:MAG: ABC transporter permease subunit [Epsilonproteobacteria bacterium]|nr:ABC transporter permease subunit [Campylobacterota bacterium]